LALEAAVIPVNRSAVSEWAASCIGDEVAECDRRVAEIEREMPSEGTPARDGLPSPAAFAIARAVEGRSAGESGSAPSLSVQHVLTPSEERKPTRRWPVLALAASVGVCLLCAGLWVHRRAEPHDPTSTTLTPVMSTLATLNANAPRATAALPPVAPPAVGAPPEVASAAPSATPASSAGSGAAVSGAHKVHRTIPAALAKTAAPDRIYRRD
jgi:hypothetical protein